MDQSFYRGLGLELERGTHRVYFDSPMNWLVEKAVQMKQGHLSKQGALVVTTGKHTGRSANDKYIVKSATTENDVWWENNINAMTPENFERLKNLILEEHNKPRDLFITERSVGAMAEHNLGVRLVTTHPQHALFSKYLFRYKLRDLDKRDFTILHAPELEVNPNEFDTKSGTVIVTCFDTRTTLIVGTLYAGEIKKSMFSVMNYLLPEKGVLPMHAGASRLENGESSIFFGLSGTGKTTLSTDEGTYLIGDDEHGLGPEGVFNFEGGCYAKTDKLSETTEPGIYRATTQFGSLLENVVLTEKTGEPDFFDSSLTENGRASYPLDFIDDLEPTGKGQLPSHMFFLCADAFGVLPPVAKLTKEQAMFYFVLGYTAKLAGTEVGLKEPKATFSACFGAPFMIRHPSAYAKLLGEYLDQHDINVWLINTGWCKGPYGVGERFPLPVTREIVRTIQKNTLNIVQTDQDPIFGLHVPHAVRNVPTSLLKPEQGWPGEGYQEKAQELAASFHQQMQKFGSFYDENLAGAPLYNKGH